MDRAFIDRSLELEAPLVLPALDGKNILSIVNKAGRERSEKVVVFAHGLTGSGY